MKLISCAKQVFIKSLRCTPKQLLVLSKSVVESQDVKMYNVKLENDSFEFGLNWVKLRYCSQSASPEIFIDGYKQGEQWLKHFSRVLEGYPQIKEIIVFKKFISDTEGPFELFCKYGFYKAAFIPKIESLKERVKYKHLEEKEEVEIGDLFDDL